MSNFDFVSDEDYNK